MEKIIENLENTFSDVTDLSDPSSMDKVITILEQARLENDEYMELLVNKLDGEEPTWDQPPYQAITGLTRKPPTKLSEQCANGHFTQREKEIVQKNWTNFVKEYEVPDTPIRLARWKNRRTVTNTRCAQERARNFVMAYLARGLQRNLYQLYRYFLKEYGYPVKLRTYTATEEKIMEICFIHHPKEACVILPEVLGREPRGIYKRYADFFNGKPEPRPKLKWKLELAAKFISLLQQYSGCRFKKLKNNQFDKQVWLQMQEELGPAYKHLKEFWFSKLHVQLFTKCNIKINTVKKIICKKLENSPYEIWMDIRWKDMAKEFPDGITDLFLYKTAKSMWCMYADYLTCPLRELLARAALDADTRWIKRRLKMLKYNKDGNLTFVTYDISFKTLMKKTKIKEK